MVGQTGRGGKEKCSNRAAHTVARAGDRSMQPMSETPHASRRKAPAADCLCLQAAARRAFRPSPSWERACDRQDSTQRRGASSSCRLGVRAGPVSRDPWAGPGRRMERDRAVRALALARSPRVAAAAACPAADPVVVVPIDWRSGSLAGCCSCSALVAGSRPGSSITRSP